VLTIVGVEETILEQAVDQLAVTVAITIPVHTHVSVSCATHVCGWPSVAAALAL
jgi:hypothetical protein